MCFWVGWVADDVDCGHVHDNPDAVPAGRGHLQRDGQLVLGSALGIYLNSKMLIRNAHNNTRFLKRTQSSTQSHCHIVRIAVHHFSAQSARQRTTQLHRCLHLATAIIVAISSAAPSNGGAHIENRLGCLCRSRTTGCRRLAHRFAQLVSANFLLCGDDFVALGAQVLLSGLHVGRVDLWQ